MRKLIMKYTTKMIFISLILITGCATYPPTTMQRSGVIIDPKNVDIAKFDQDIVECEQVAKQVQDKAVAGAIGGAIYGAIIGSIIGDGNNDFAKGGAKLGAAHGGAQGLGETAYEKSTVMKNCIRNRGYVVLN